MSVNGLRIVIIGVNVLGLPVGSQITVAHAEATAQRRSRREGRTRTEAGPVGFRLSRC